LKWRLIRVLVTVWVKVSLALLMPSLAVIWMS